MSRIIVFVAAILMASCAKLEFEEIVESPVSIMIDSINHVAMNTEGNDWQIYSLYFIDKNTKMRRAKFRKVLNEPRWFYQEIDTIEDYKVLSDAAHPYLMQNDYELGELKSSFIYEGDTVRIHRCGDYPLENPKYSLLVVTVKEGNHEYIFTHHGRK